MSSPSSSSPHYYSIHDILHIRSNVDLPIPDYFRISSPPTSFNFDIDVSEESLSLPFTETEMHRCSIFFVGHNESQLAIDYRLPFLNVKLLLTDLENTTKISFTKDFKRFGDLTNLFNTILLFKFIQKEHTLVHSGCISTSDNCYLISGMRDTGKTSTVLSLVDGTDIKFMSDDLTVISQNGQAFSYPTPVGISPYTLTGTSISYTPPAWKQWVAKHQLLLFGFESVFKLELSKRMDVPSSLIDTSGTISDVFLLRSANKNEISSIPSSVAVQKLLMTTTELIDPFRIYSLNFYAYYTDFDSAMLFEKEKGIIENALSNATCYDVCANNVKEFHRLIQKQVDL